MTSSQLITSAKTLFSEKVPCWGSVWTWLFVQPYSTQSRDDDRWRPLWLFSSVLYLRWTIISCWLFTIYNRQLFTSLCPTKWWGVESRAQNFALFLYFIICLFVFSSHVACRILVPLPEIEPLPSAMEAQSPNHWTKRKFSCLGFFTPFSIQGVARDHVYDWPSVNMNEISSGYSHFLQDWPLGYLPLRMLESRRMSEGFWRQTNQARAEKPPTTLLLCLQDWKCLAGFLSVTCTLWDTFPPFWPHFPTVNEGFGPLSPNPFISKLLYLYDHMGHNQPELRLLREKHRKNQWGKLPECISFQFTVTSLFLFSCGVCGSGEKSLPLPGRPWAEIPPVKIAKVPESNDKHNLFTPTLHLDLLSFWISIGYSRLWVPCWGGVWQIMKGQRLPREEIFPLYQNLSK